MKKKLITFIITLIMMGTSSSFALEKKPSHSIPQKRSIQVMEARKVFLNQGCESNEPMESFGDLIGGPGDETATPGGADCCYMGTITFSADATGTGQAETFNQCMCPAGCISGCED